MPVEHDFWVADSSNIVFASGPFVGLGPFPFAGYGSTEAFESALSEAWAAYCQRQSQVLTEVRRSFGNARFDALPTRVVASVEYEHAPVRLLFSPDGRRAVIIGIGDRPVSIPPVEPRVVIPVDPDLPRSQLEEILTKATAQARRHAPQPEDLAQAEALSIDLGSSDLLY